jgi:hypothetical protein
MIARSRGRPAFRDAQCETGGAANNFDRGIRIVHRHAALITTFLRFRRLHTLIFSASISATAASHGILALGD